MPVDLDWTHIICAIKHIWLLLKVVVLRAIECQRKVWVKSIYAPLIIGIRSIGGDNRRCVVRRTVTSALLTWHNCFIVKG
jgi:hypothetical protein